MRHGRGLERREQSRSFIAAGHGRLGHAVVQYGRHLAQLLGAQLGGAQQTGLHHQAVFGQALHAAQLKTAVVGNVGGLGCPRRHSAHAGADHDHGAIGGTGIRLAIGQQGREGLFLGIGQRCGRGHQVHKTGGDAHNLRRDFCQTWQNLGNAKVAEGAGAFESRDVQGHGVAL
jgi:hypothetical protein